MGNTLTIADNMIQGVLNAVVGGVGLVVNTLTIAEYMTQGVLNAVVGGVGLVGNTLTIAGLLQVTLFKY